VNASVHYHDVDDEARTTFAMASMWHAGLRVTDVRVNDYRFLTERAQDACSTYGVMSVSIGASG
jgi:hypothetical protein